MRKNILTAVLSTAMTTVMTITSICPAYAETKNVPSTMEVTAENMFDGATGVTVSIPDSIPLTVNEETKNYEFTDYVSAAGIVYDDQTLTIALGSETIQYKLDTDASITIDGTANIYIEDTAGTQAVYAADKLVQNYKEEKSGTLANEVTNKNKLQVVVDKNDVNYLGEYSGVVIFETTLSEHTES